VLEKDCAELHIVRRRQPIAAVAVLNFAVSKTPATRTSIKISQQTDLHDRAALCDSTETSVECLLRVKRRKPHSESASASDSLVKALLIALIVNVLVAGPEQFRPWQTG
jgi:hypothetical protein